MDTEIPVGEQSIKCNIITVATMLPIYIFYALAISFFINL